MKYSIASASEKLIWKRHRENPSDPGLVLSYGFLISSTFEKGFLEKVLRSVIINSFPNLLCHFFEKDGMLYKQLNPQAKIKLFETDYTPDLNKTNHIDHSSDLLYYFCYQKIDSDKHFLGLQFSHLVFDGNCYESFCQAFEKAWEEVTAGRITELSVSDQPEKAIDVTTTESEIYWKEKLSKNKLSHTLPFARSTTHTNERYYTIREEIREEEFQNLMTKVKECNSSVFQMLTSVFSATIFKYHPEAGEAVNLSHTVSNKMPDQPHGCYLNILPFPVPQSLDWSPANYLDRVKQERRSVRPYQHHPTENIITLAPEKLNRGSKLFNVIINHSQGLLPVRTPDIKGVEITLLQEPATGGPFDIALNYSYNDERLRLSFDAPSDTISYTVLNAFLKNFRKTLRFFIYNTSDKLKELTFNEGLVPIDSGYNGQVREEASLNELLKKQFQRNAHKTAVVFQERAMSYAEVMNMSLLIAKKIAESTPEHELKKGIALCLSRSEILPVAIQAALLLKVPFVPVEHSLPPSRIDYMLEAADVKVMLTDDQCEQTVSSLKSTLNCINIERHEQEKWVVDGGDVEYPDSGNETAYTIFTSGSTGAPKGVSISRKNLQNFLDSMLSLIPCSEQDYLFALTSVSFDISILELVLPFYTGATLEVIDEDTKRSAPLLADKINNSPVTLIQSTPSIWRLLKAANWKASHPLTILSGGENLEKELAAYLLEQSPNVYNMYGPTEATIWASVQRIMKPESILLGNAVHHSHLYVVDEHLQSVSPGMTGELLISGDCVGLGYLNYDSNEVFIELPETGEKAYLTGDYVTNLGDGQIEYVGRKGGFRKLNGYRIETEEITNKLRSLYPQLEIVTVIREESQPYLCSFYWSESQTTIDVEKTLRDLGNVLPYYMIPQRILKLESLPLTPNGKLNTKFLSQGDLTDIVVSEQSVSVSSQEVSDATDDETLSKLKNILLETLDLHIEDLSTPLGYLGLNSIGYTQLSKAIEREFSVKIATHEFYQLMTLNGIKGAIDQRSETNTKTPKVPATEQNQAVHSYKPITSGNEKQKIAIVGYSVLMPDNMEADAFWKALLDHKNLVSSSSLLDGYTASAGFLKENQNFDALFFSISPLEAKYMDPRQSLMLQTAWRTLEDAAYTPTTLKGQNIGCYMAATGNDFSSLQAKKDTPAIPYSLTGQSLSILSNRISNFFDWNGPSFTLDTACSGALTALVKACNDLAYNTCDAAFVGGINLILDEQVQSGLEAGGFMSPDKRCATFDKDANGYVRGEGMGGLFIKRLEDAQKDSDHIHAVIESYVENHGGRSNSLTAPNPNAQKNLLLKAYTPELARELSYIETHGTGTKLGDPIEIDALKQAWDKLLSGGWEHPVWLGAVKSNIGHLEAAAGMASLAKVIQAIKYRKLPANLHFNEVNPLIQLENTPFRILEESKDWDDHTVLKAGISSFGFGGTNAHIVVAEPPVQDRTDASAEKLPFSTENMHLFVLSAKSEASLTEMKEEMIRFFSQNKEIAQNQLADVAYTLSTGREHFEYRIAWIASSVEECLDYLTNEAEIHQLSRTELNYTLEEFSDQHEQEMLLSFRKAYLKGAKISWQEWYAHQNCRKLSLPTYRFAGKQLKLRSGKVKSQVLPKEI